MTDDPQPSRKFDIYSQRFLTILGIILGLATIVGYLASNFHPFATNTPLAAATATSTTLANLPTETHLPTTLTVTATPVIPQPTATLSGTVTLTLGDFFDFETNTVSAVTGQIQWERDHNTGAITLLATQNAEPEGLTRLGDLGITNFDAITCQQIQHYTGFAQGSHDGSKYVPNVVFLIELHEHYPTQFYERFGKAIVLGRNNTSLQIKWTLYPIGC